MVRNKISIALATFVVMATPLVAMAATTVGNNVSVGGNFNVTGATTLTGAATLSSSLTVTGLTTMVGGFISNASSSVGAELQIAGALKASSTLGVTDVATFYAGAYFGTTPGVTISDSSITLTEGTAAIDSSNSGAAGTLNIGTNTYNVIIGRNASAATVRPPVDNTTNLGTFGKAWKNAYVSSTVFMSSSTIANTTGTSTQYIYSPTANRGGQIVLKAYDGNCYAVYMGNSGGQMQVTSSLLASCY